MAPPIRFVGKRERPNRQLPDPTRTLDRIVQDASIAVFDLDVGPDLAVLDSWGEGKDPNTVHTVRIAYRWLEGEPMRAHVTSMRHDRVPTGPFATAFVERQLRRMIAELGPSPDVLRSLTARPGYDVEIAGETRFVDVLSSERPDGRVDVAQFVIDNTAVELMVASLGSSNSRLGEVFPLLRRLN